MKNPWKQYSKLNPQREDGNRQIASDVFHALMSAELSGSEFRVVMAIIDKTWGFNKDSDCISATQFMTATGLAERTIKESVKILKKKRVIVYTPSNIRVRQGSPLNEFIFNKHYDTWKTEGCRKVHGCRKVSEKGEQKRNTRVRRSSPTKETSTKETIQKKGRLFLCPSLDEIQKYCQERKNNIDPELWLSHYESNGWMVGKNKMKDWKAAIRTWEKSSYGGNKNGTNQRDYRTTADREIDAEADRINREYEARHKTPDTGNETS